MHGMTGLRMAMQGVYVSHAIAGRVRIKLPKVKGNPVLAAELERRLAAMQVVQWVEVSPLTGSVLLGYDSRLLESLHTLKADDPPVKEALEALPALAELVGINPQDIDMRAIEQWLQASTNGAKPSGGLWW
jgi:Heavy metal associated domain 2